MGGVGNISNSELMTDGTVKKVRKIESPAWPITSQLSQLSACMMVEWGAWAASMEL